MLKYEELKEREREFLDMTGLTGAEFEEMLPFFEKAWERQMNEQNIDGSQRIARSYSAYKNSPLPRSVDKLLFILVYLKQAPTQTLQGRLFGMSQPNANKWIHLLHPVLNHLLRVAGQLPARHAPALRSRLGEGDPPAPPEGAPRPLGPAGGRKVFFHDGTERLISRPTDTWEQTVCYSGKKKPIA